MKIAVCDDEAIFRRELCAYIAKNSPEATIMEFSDGSDLLRSREDIDIIFLDIEMPGLDGMDTAARLRSLSIGSIIIFLTSHVERMQDAFKVKAFRFLPKPVMEDALGGALAEAVKEISKQ